MAIKVGVIGLGYWGPNLVRNFCTLPGSELVTGCDLQVERCQKIASLYPSIRFTQNVQEVFESKEINAVAIATPVRTHYPLVKQALAAGQHVLITKPLTDNAAHAEELINLADKKRLILQVDHTFIYHPAVERLKDIVMRGELGDLYYFDSVRINLGLFQTDVSVIWDLAPHDISIMEHLISRPVQWVQAVCTRLRLKIVKRWRARSDTSFTASRKEPLRSRMADQVFGWFAYWQPLRKAFGRRANEFPFRRLPKRDRPGSFFAARKT